MKTCENCQTEHNSQYKNVRFCSLKCAKSFSTKAKRNQINKKVSLALTRENYVNLICQFCKNSFCVPYNKRTQISCSRSCANKLKWNNEEFKKNISKIQSNIAKNRHKNNEDFGWKTRKKLQPSYPESLAIKTLDSLNIKYEREMKFKKFFIDFAIHEKKIIIEIDGQQHKLKERKEIDNRKDLLLKKEGWNVFRIKWPTDNIVETIRKIIECHAKR